MNTSKPHVLSQLSQFTGTEYYYPLWPKVMLTDGTKSILVGSLVNSGLEGAAIQLSYPDAGTIKQAQVNLNAGQKFDLGYNGTAALPAVTEAKAGGLVEVTIKTGDSEATMSVPVLDGTLPEYKAVLDAN